MTVMLGAEPYENLADTPSGRRVGILLTHGFSGTPQSLRGWAAALEERGWSVSVPLLPGHGTTWQEMNTTPWTDWYGAAEAALSRIASHSEKIVVAGLSMGATLALRLTQQYPSGGAHELGGQLAGTMVVNPSLATQRRDAWLLPFAQRFIGSFPGIANDIAKPGARELAYDRLPLKAAYSLRELWSLVRADLPQITGPLAVYQSATDHVVEAISTRILLDQVGSSDLTHHVLPRSFHVATLDYDADYIFSTSIEWIERIVGAA